MGISVQWDNDEQTIIQYVFEGRWTWNDLYAALDQVQTMAASVDHQVDAIIDLTGADLMPAGAFFSFDGRRNAQKLASKADAARGLIVIAGANAFIRSLYDALRTLNASVSTGIHFTGTTAQARSYLLEQQALAGEKAS
jgi:hypothetical protein